MANDLTKGPVGANLRRQATPFALALVAIFSFEAVDLFFIGQLGDAPLAAVAFTLPIIWLLYGVGIGFEAGAASCVSRAIGKGNQYQARRLTTDTAVLGALVALVMCFIGLATIGPVFSLLGAPLDLMPQIQAYMGVWYWVHPVDVGLWTCLASIRARGNALLESKIIVASAILNLILDPILIFGLFGFPRLEIQGAAVATLVSVSVMLIYTIWHLNSHLKVFAPIVAPIKEILASWKHMLAIGIPAIISNAIVPLSSAIVIAMVAGYGVDAVAGFGIAMRLEPTALIPFYALSAVSSPFFGQNFGAGHFDRLLEARRIIMRFSLGFGLCLAIGLSLLAKPMAGLFTDSEAIQSVAASYIWIVSWSWGAYGIVMSANAGFNGSGRPLPGVMISTLRVVIVFLPLAFLGRWLLGLNGLFIASSLANMAVGAMAYLWIGKHIRDNQFLKASKLPTSSSPETPKI
jgi:putative MATE family efflux protein